MHLKKKLSESTEPSFRFHFLSLFLPFGMRAAPFLLGFFTANKEILSLNLRKLDFYYIAKRGNDTPLPSKRTFIMITIYSGEL